MKASATQLNEWLLSNGQDAIKNLSNQGLSLRFVDGPENFHQDRPSLAVCAEGVGFTFQMNHYWYTDPESLLAQAVDRASDFQRAFAAAREQYGTKPLPIQPRKYDSHLIIRGEHWDICNHQLRTTKMEANAQSLNWQQHFDIECHQDVAQLVAELCERQALFDRLANVKEVLAIVREKDSLTFDKSEEHYALKADPRCGFHFEYGQDIGGNKSIQVLPLYCDEDYGRYWYLYDDSKAMLSPRGIRYSTEGREPMTPEITAQEFGVDPDWMTTMANLGMTPLELLRFDAQMAESETSAAQHISFDMDNDIFLSDDVGHGAML